MIFSFLKIFSRAHILIQTFGVNLVNNCSVVQTLDMGNGHNKIWLKPLFESRVPQNVYFHNNFKIDFYTITYFCFTIVNRASQITCSILVNRKLQEMQKRMRDSPHFLCSKNLTQLFLPPLFSNTAANFIYIMVIPTCYNVFKRKEI